MELCGRDGPGGARTSAQARFLQLQSVSTVSIGVYGIAQSCWHHAHDFLEEIGLVRSLLQCCWEGNADGLEDLAAHATYFAA